MTFDRTRDLVKFLRGSERANEVPMIDEESKTRAGLRNRHRRERFALQDDHSPQLPDAVLSDSDLERVSTPPSETFVGRAASVLLDIQQAKGLVLMAKGRAEIHTVAIQQILDLCLQHIKVLQDLADELSTERRMERGWLAALKGDNSLLHQQIDQHEAAIIWFLNHRLSLLNREYENVKVEEEERIRKQRQIKAIALGSVRPTKNPVTIEATPTMVMEETQFQEKYHVSDAQMQQLMAENDCLLREYTEMQSALVTTQTSIKEISRLQTTLQEQLVYQATQIDRLFDDSMTTTETVRKANVQLGQAAGTMSRSVRFFIVFVFFATFFLLLLHFLAD